MSDAFWTFGFLGLVGLSFVIRFLWTIMNDVAATKAHVARLAEDFYSRVSTPDASNPVFSIEDLASASQLSLKASGECLEAQGEIRELLKDIKRPYTASPKVRNAMADYCRKRVDAQESAIKFSLMVEANLCVLRGETTRDAAIEKYRAEVKNRKFPVGGLGTTLQSELVDKWANRLAGDLSIEDSALFTPWETPWVG